MYSMKIHIICNSYLLWRNMDDKKPCPILLIREIEKKKCYKHQTSWDLLGVISTKNSLWDPHISHFVRVNFNIVINTKKAYIATMERNHIKKKKKKNLLDIAYWRSRSPCSSAYWIQQNAWYLLDKVNQRSS